MLLPGSTIGMLGGGQLGRMFTIAARTLGYKVIVLEPDPFSPAGQLADEHQMVAYDDVDALKVLGKKCDVVTTEFENIPASTLELLTEYCPVRPSATAVKVAQNRIVEKEFVRSCGLMPVPFAAIREVADIAATGDSVQFPAILKTTRLGYDGKGQVIVESPAAAKAAFNNFNQVECVLEQRVDLACEISVILGRNVAGESQCFPVAENIHHDGILHQTIAPARVARELSDTAKAAAQRIADKLDFVGVMAVEFFVTKQGELLINEMAPRTHNSGHYTLDACNTSQFEQQVRMVCDLPFGDTTQHTPVVMTNLLGDVWGENQPKWNTLFNSPHSKLHLYGKHEARPGRKMGHFCTLDSDIDRAIQESNDLFVGLQG
uniref:N5-carboxyaminoimidazole ribonucleotide synthase n=1 Tax=uncultured Thiotrichaceae bacterium TaxID=298394 RepID=A0A6S6UJZ8_9GAMM|nr:MAG: Phosphoribosylaminoimidazole carboxylase ATPase subunit (EC [uncultured Thiotrichaceae bacterium]